MAAGSDRDSNNERACGIERQKLKTKTVRYLLRAKPLAEIGVKNVESMSDVWRLKHAT